MSFFGSLFSSKKAEDPDAKLDFSFQGLREVPLNKISRPHVVRVLDLSHNQLADLEHLDTFTALEELILDVNRLKSSSQIPYMPKLRVFSANSNAISNLAVFIEKLQKSTPNLTFLSILKNDACPNFFNGGSETDYSDYRLFVISKLSHLHTLDSSKITDDERQQGKALYGTLLASPIQVQLQKERAKERRLQKEAASSGSSSSLQESIPQPPPSQPSPSPSPGTAPSPRTAPAAAGIPIPSEYAAALSKADKQLYSQPQLPQQQHQEEQPVELTPEEIEAERMRRLERRRRRKEREAAAALAAAQAAQAEAEAIAYALQASAKPSPRQPQPSPRHQQQPSPRVSQPVAVNVTALPDPSSLAPLPLPPLSSLPSLPSPSSAAQPQQQQQQQPSVVPTVLSAVLPSLEEMAISTPVKRRPKVEEIEVQQPRTPVQQVDAEEEKPVPSPRLDVVEETPAAAPVEPEEQKSPYSARRKMQAGSRMLPMLPSAAVVSSAEAEGVRMTPSAIRQQQREMAAQLKKEKEEIAAKQQQEREQQEQQQNAEERQPIEEPVAPPAHTAVKVNANGMFMPKRPPSPDIDDE